METKIPNSCRIFSKTYSCSWLTSFVYMCVGFCKSAHMQLHTTTGWLKMTRILSMDYSLLASGDSKTKLSPANGWYFLVTLCEFGTNRGWKKSFSLPFIDLHIYCKRGQMTFGTNCVPKVEVFFHNHFSHFPSNKSSSIVIMRIERRGSRIKKWDEQHQIQTD